MKSIVKVQSTYRGSSINLTKDIIKLFKVEKSEPVMIEFINENELKITRVNEV